MPKTFFVITDCARRRCCSLRASLLGRCHDRQIMEWILRVEARGMQDLQVKCILCGIRLFLRRLSKRYLRMAGKRACDPFPQRAMGQCQALQPDCQAGSRIDWLPDWSA